VVLETSNYTGIHYVATRDFDTKTRSLILHALTNMFHYLDEHCIAATTNKPEGYFSMLKEIYRKHRGLSKKHR
jgi:hypothetical protein